MVKTFIFAVHALAYDKLIEKVRGGEMPNMRSLTQDGCYGVSRSVFSTASAVDYISLLTGCAPASHGIDDFQTGTVQGSQFSRAPSNYSMERKSPEELEDSRLYTSYDVEVPWTWEMMEKEKVMQFGVFSPATYPAPELPNDGVWISGYWNNPQLLKDNVAAANDQEVRKKLVDNYEDYPITPYLAIPPVSPDDVESELGYLQRKIEVDKEMSSSIHKARREAVKDEDWDILLSEEFFCDNVQHLVWPRSEDNPLRNDVDEMLEKKDLLGEFYRHIDDVLGSYIEQLPENANIIVISAHGQTESEDDGGMYEQFDKLFKYGVWRGPERWNYKDDKPEYMPVSRAEHSKNGVYVASGPDFAEGGESEAISCMDFTPLMLEIYDYEKPEHLDGRVPKHILSD